MTKKSTLEANIELYKHQNEFNYRLNTILNGKGFSKFDLIVQCIYSNFLARKYSRSLVSGYKQLSFPESSLIPSKVKLKSHKGGIANINNISKTLEPLHPYLKYVFIHGSLGSNVAIAYSDFDGLLVLKNEAFSNEKAIFKIISGLKKSIKAMAKYDVLQHHGWFVITEKDMEAYCEAYLPIESFREATLLYPQKTTTVNFIIRNSNMEFCNAYKSLANSILAQKKEHVLHNPFKLKAFLSQVMLVPTLFLQAYNGRGISKKESFSVIKDIFDADILEPIIIASHIRQEWINSGGWISLFVKQAPVCIRSYILKKYPVKIKKSISEKIDDDYFRKLETMIVNMTDILKEKQKEK